MGWSSKLIYAKKCLRGLAKLLIQSEQKIKSWTILKQKVRQEFEVKVSSAQIHKQLMIRKEKKDEAVQE